MQLKLFLYGKHTEIPMNIHRSVHGAIYRALSTEPEYSQALHTQQIDLGKTFKGFTFGDVSGDLTVVGSRRYITGIANLEIRSVDSHMTELLAVAFLHSRHIQLDWATVEIADVLLTDRHIDAPVIDVRMLSPVVAYITLPDRRTTFFGPEDESFYNLLRVNAERKSRHFLGEAFSLSAEPLFTHQPPKQTIVFKKTPLIGWYGDYRLTANPGLLNLLYNTGLGAKNSEGLGMFDILSSCDAAK